MPRHPQPVAIASGEADALRSRFRGELLENQPQPVADAPGEADAQTVGGAFERSLAAPAPSAPAAHASLNLVVDSIRFHA